MQEPFLPARSKLLLVILILAAVLSLSTTVYGVPPDTTPPTVETPSIEPANPGPGDGATVSVVVTDARGVRNVSIVYTTDNWTASNVVLYASYNSTSGVAKATIPPQPGGTRVSYKVVAYDTSGNRGVNDNAGAYFTYEVASGPATSITSFWGLVVIAVIAAAAGMILLGYFTRRKRTGPLNQPRGRRQSSTQTQP